MHYVYKITNRKTGSYYIGSRTHPHPELDTYMGSSKILNRLYEIEGLNRFKKTVLRIFNTRKEANLYERTLVQEGFKQNPKLLYNRRTPGTIEAEKYIGIRADLWTDYFDDICKNYRAGHSMRALAKKYGCDIRTVGNILQSIGIKIRSTSDNYKLTVHWRKGSCSIPKKIQQTIVKEYCSTNIPVYQLAKKYSISEPTLRKMLRESNVEFREVGFTSKSRKYRHPAWAKVGEIKKDLEKHTKQYVCEKYGLGWVTLQKILEKEAKEAVS